MTGADVKQAKKAKKPPSTPPLSLRLDLLEKVRDELIVVASTETDPARADKLRGIARRFVVALELNRVVGVEWPARRNKAIAKGPREGARSTIRASVVRAMSSARRESEPFKAFLEHWLQGPINELRLSYDDKSDRYVVVDETGKASPKSYKLESLTGMYSKPLKP